MPYLGNSVTSTEFKTDQFTGDGSTVAFTLTETPASKTALLVIISGVKQHTDTYSVVGTTITFTEAPPNLIDFEVIHMGIRREFGYIPGTLQSTDTQNLTVGYTTDVDAFGTSNSITPDMSLESIKSVTISGTLTINFPIGGNGVCHIIITADSTDRSVVLGTNIKSVGSIPILAANKSFLATLIRDTATHAILQILEINA